MPLKLFLRGEVWHYRGTVAGRRLRGSTGVSRQNKEVAAQVVVSLEHRAWQGNLNPGGTITYAQAALLYRSAGKPTRFLDRVEDYWRDTPVKEITAGKIRASCADIYPSASKATWNRAVIVPTQAVINHAAEQELCPKVFVKRWPVESKVRTPASWIWVQDFMRASSPQLGALACFMLLTGARISEALSLVWEDVDFTRHRALIRQTKVGSERSAHLPHDLLIAMANIPGEHRSDELVFGYRWRSTVKKHWDKAVAVAGIKRLTPHCNRHGFATGLLHAGVDPITVSKLGGWKNAAHVFATYGHAREDRTLANLLTRQEHSSTDDEGQALENKRKLG